MVFHRERFYSVLLYINDLPSCLQHSQPRMYTDDTSITFAGNDVDEMNNCINLDLDGIRVWLAANKTLNMTKTEFLLIGSQQRLLKSTAKPTATINEVPIKQVWTVKSLGVPVMKILLGSAMSTNCLQRLLLV